MFVFPFSRKTTRAKELENEVHALRLAPDEWHVNLFGHDVSDREHDKRYSLIERLICHNQLVPILPVSFQG
jgi:predicted kinase